MADRAQGAVHKKIHFEYEVEISSPLVYAQGVKQFRVIYQDEHLLAIDKPAGILVHPAVLRGNRVQARVPDVIRILRKQLEKKVYPVHRLDRATSGVLLLALSPDSAKLLQAQFQNQQIQKTYFALVRGWTKDADSIESPLSARLDGGPERAAETHYQTIHRFELPIPSSRFSTSRFSIIKVEPKTGRLHQIRRHLKRISHPIIGDTVHGDGKQNLIWRELTHDQRLYLKAHELRFVHPISGQDVVLESKWSAVWKRVFEKSGITQCDSELKVGGSTKK